jgi:tape measure domain-containing protein
VVILSVTAAQLEASVSVTGGDEAVEILNAIASAVDALIGQFANMPSFNLGDSIASAASAIADIGSVGEEAASGLEDVASGFDDASSQSNSFMDNLSLIGSGLGGLASAIGGVPLANFTSGIQDLASSISDTASSAFTSFTNGIQSIASSISDTISGPVNSFTNGIQNIASGISDVVSGPINSFINGVQQVGSTISDAVSGPVNSFIDGIQTFASNISEAASGPINDLMSGISGLASNINDAASSAFENFTTGVQNMSSSIMDFSNQSLSQAKSGLSNFTSGIGNVIGGIGELGNKLGMGIMNFQMIGMQANQTAQSLLGPAVSAETMQTAFDTLMGSTQKATNMLNQLDAFAAKTDFKTMDIDQAASQMLGFGINAKNVIPDLTAIGDALSAVGKGSTANLDSIVNIFGKIQLAGKITGADMTQFSDDGINAWGVLEKQTGKTQAQLQAMISAGLLPAGTALNDLTKGIEASPLYSGGMAKQSATTAGLISTLQSNWNQLMVAFGSPILKALEPMLNNVGTALTNPAFKQFAATMGQDLVSGISAVVTGIGKLISTGEAVANFFQKNQLAMDGLKAVLIGLAAGVGAFVLTTLPALIAGFITWAVTAGAAALATLAAALPFIAIGAVVALVALGIIEAIQHWGAIMNWISGLVSDVCNAVSGFFKGLYDDIIGHSTIPDMVNGIVDWFIQLNVRAVQMIINLVTSVGSYLGGLGAKALGWAIDMMNGFIGGILSALSGVASAVARVASIIASFLHFSKPDIGPLVDVDNWMPDFGDALAKGLGDQISKVQAPALKLASQLALSINPNVAALPAGISAIPANIAGAAQPVQVVFNPVITLDGKQISNNTMTRMVKSTRISGPIRSNLS